MINCNYKVTGTLVLLAIVSVTCSSASNSELRDLTAFRFPGPRPSLDDSLATNDPLTAAAAGRSIVKREPQYSEDSPYDYNANTRSAGATGYRASSAQQAPSPLPYQQEPSRYNPSPAPSAYNAPRSTSSRSPSVNYGNSASGSQYGSPAGSSASPSAASEEQPEEEKQGPSKLELLLAQSKFACDSKKDGYYADTSVGCQVFHYCVQGAKHSWMCPDQTVFHQVHLNCVPAAQDICAQSEKFFVVNDYLHKEIDQRGPNNSVRYHQRYYPEEFLGDAALNIPQSFGFAPNEAPIQSAPQRVASAPANSYSPQAQRPSRPSYSEESDSSPYYKPQSYANSPAAATQSYKPIATRSNSYSPSASSSGYGSTSASNSALNQYSPSSYSASASPSSASASSGLSASRSTSSNSYPSSIASSAYPAAYQSTPSQSYSQSARQSSGGLRYAQSSGVPVSYQPTSSRATASSSTGSSSSPSASSSSLYSPVSGLSSRPTASPYSPYTASPYSSAAVTPSAASPSRYSSYPRASSSSLSSSLPSSSSSSSSSSAAAASPYSQYSPYSSLNTANYAAASASDPSAALRTRFSSAISTGENYSPLTANRFKSGVIYESDY